MADYQKAAYGVGSAVDGLGTTAKQDTIDMLTDVDFVLHKAAADAMAADATAEHTEYTVRVRRACRIDTVRLIPNGALTADAANNATLTVSYDDGAGGANTNIASGTTTAGGTGSWVAGTAITLTIATTGGVSVAAGKYITFAITKAMAGVVVPEFTLVCSGQLTS